VTGFPCLDGGKAEQVASLASMVPAHPFNGLAVSTSPWQPFPEGTIIWLAAPGSAYQEAARVFVIAQGLDDPAVEVRNAVSVDLNGDGVNETVFEATSIQSHFAINAGDYSVILLRRISGDTVETVPLAAEVYMADGALGAVPKVNYLTAVLNLDGDGRPEIVVDQLEGDVRRTFVYTLPQLEPEIVLTAGCRSAVTPERLALLDLGIYDLNSPGIPASTRLRRRVPVLAAGFPDSGRKRDESG
jgi:hypothetical protein